MSIATDEIRKMKEKVLDYSGYGLNYNPFPASGVSPDTANIDVLRTFLEKYFYEKIRAREITQLIRDIIRSGYIERSARHMWLWGDWRVGKSTILMKLFLALRDELQDCITVYVPKPRYGLVKSIYYYFTREYTPEFFFGLARKLLVKVISENPHLIQDDWVEIWKESQESLKDKTVHECKLKLVEEIKNDIIDVFSLISEEAIDPEKLYDVCVAKLSPEGVTEDIIETFTDPKDPETLYRNILELGEKRNYSDHLIALFMVCIISGYQHIFVFIDDVEDVIRLWTRGKAEKETDELNNFLDRMHSNLSLLGTMHPQFFDLWKERYGRFVGRASADPLNFTLVEVKPLESDVDIMETVSYFISKACKTTPPYPTYPFKEEVIKDLHKRLQGKLGLILPSLHSLLRKGAEIGTETGKYPEIDMDFYEKMKKGVLEEISS
jgi:hypothetical protein